MRPIALCSVLLLVACAEPDPCAGHDGTCLALLVESGGGPLQIDQLNIVTNGFAEFNGNTPATPSLATLPVTTALFLPDSGGDVFVTVIGLLNGAPIGWHKFSTSLGPREHGSVTVVLSTMALPDLTMTRMDFTIPHDLSMPRPMEDLPPEDLGGLDLAGTDIADAAAPAPDLVNADLTLPVARHVFLRSPAAPANLGTQQGLDNDCSAQAVSAGIPGSAVYRAVIAYPGADPITTIRLGQGRPIVLPSGAPVATDATFFSLTHDGPIDELADATHVNSGCVWTDFGPGGSAVPGSFDCAGWTITSGGNSAVIGDCTAADINWSITTTTPCDSMSCYVYCIEQ